MFIRRDKSDELFYNEFLNESERLQQSVQAGIQHHFAYEDLSQDLFTMLYEPRPQDIEAPCPAGLQVARQAIDQIKELREYQDLHRLTALDPMASGFATENMGKSLLSLLPKVGPKSEEDLKNEIDVAGELGLKGAQARAEEMLKQLSAKNAKAGRVKVDGDSLRQKLRVALSNAMQAAQDGQDACSAFGCGNEPGKPQQVGLKDKMEMAKLIAKSKKLKEIAKLAGRFTRIAKKKQMEKSTSHEINSIKTGDNLARVLPCELAKLGNEATIGLFLKSYFEKSLLEYELGGKEPNGQGPIICCIDGSGSMSGTPEESSKAIAMALMEIAKKQSRDFIMMQFSSAGQLRTFIAEKGKCEYLALLTELEFFFNGGTCFQTPLNEAVKYIGQSKYNKADIIFITDGCAVLSPEFLDKYKAMKKAKQFACVGVLIGPKAAVMENFCDEIFHVADLLNDKTNDDVHDKIFKI